MKVSLMPCVSQKHSPSGWRRAPYKQRVRAPESASTPVTFHFLYPIFYIQKQNIKSSHSMRPCGLQRVGAFLMPKG